MDKLCAQAVSSYLAAIRASFETFDTDKGCGIITPFMRSDNEYIELELITKSDTEILITDNSDTIGYLFVHGLNLSRSRELRRILAQTANRFGVRIEREEIFLLTDFDSLGASMCSMINAIQDVSYLIYKKVRRGPVSFYEEVEKFLISHAIRYDLHFPVKGKSYVHNFRFHLNDKRHALIEPLSATTPHSALVRAERLAFWWTDISNIKPEYRKVAVVDDIGKREPLWQGRPINVLEQYSDLVVTWSRKERLLETLS